MSSYPYLIGTLGVSLVLLIVCRGLGRTGRVALFSGAVQAPTGIFAPSFEVYWSPTRLSGGPQGIEDFLFGFCAGVTTWLIVAAGSATARGRPDRAIGPILRRLLPFVVLPPLVYFPLLAVWDNPMPALLAGLALAGGGALAWRPDLWPLALPAGIAYPVLHGAVTGLTFLAWPELAAEWNRTHVWGQTLALGAPMGEIAWAAVFGLCWPVIIGTVLDLRPAARRA